ncbi:hypothetical protein [Sphingomonas sp. GM_Shp_2]|uniref:hypothetical protein n=1 Tax=Sphingomonas sp. GM_Shp_2 TaxID=2937380 RepID=UPI00226A5BF5|nr:hypothetical protein [Sphingomonas sp. GM_Shp_2]
MRAADKEHLFPGQAVHSGQHMVCTGLKALQTFEDTRTDLLGQQIGSENAGRYAGATRPQKLADVVDRLPIVTGRAEIIAVPSDPSS